MQKCSALKEAGKGLPWEESSFSCSHYSEQFDALSQVHFNQQPFEFTCMNVSESFAKLPFPDPRARSSCCLSRKRDMAEPVKSSYVVPMATGTPWTLSEVPFPFDICFVFLYFIRLNVLKTKL